MKFTVGDRVVGIGTYDHLCIDNRIGTVVLQEHNEWDPRIGVEFDERFDNRLHTCNGTSKKEQGWFIPADQLRHFDQRMWSESNFQDFLEGE